ncbi:hypothetical protein B0T13DRAFT_481789 [Neurospora crassa]|nr:hypothetical protein B0T13DRAFT_481789 [Neurospora crassa]
MASSSRALTRRPSETFDHTQALAVRVHARYAVHMEPGRGGGYGFCLLLDLFFANFLTGRE